MKKPDFGNARIVCILKLWPPIVLFRSRPHELDACPDKELRNWRKFLKLRIFLHVPGAATEWPTGNGNKLSSMLGCCLVYFHFLWAILWYITTMLAFSDQGEIHVVPNRRNVSTAMKSLKWKEGIRRLSLPLSFFSLTWTNDAAAHQTSYSAFHLSNIVYIYLSFVCFLKWIQSYISESISTLAPACKVSVLSKEKWLFKSGLIL